MRIREQIGLCRLPSIPFSHTSLFEILGEKYAGSASVFQNNCLQHAGLFNRRQCIVPFNQAKSHTFNVKFDSALNTRAEMENNFFCQNATINVNEMHSVLLVISRTWIRSISSSAFNSIEIIYTKSMINLMLVVFKTNTKHRFIFTCLASIICCCNLSIVLFAKAFCIWYSQFECSNILPNTNLAHTTTTTIQIEILNSENFFLLLAHAHFEQHSALYFSSSAQPLRAFIKVKCTKEGNAAHCMENVTGFRNKP